jgi:hypothetical protein
MAVTATLSFALTLILTGRFAWAIAKLSTPESVLVLCTNLSIFERMDQDNIHLPRLCV